MLKQARKLLEEAEDFVLAVLAAAMFLLFTAVVGIVLCIYKKWGD